MSKKTPAKKPDYKRLKRLYGITEKDYETLLKRQNNSCFICQRDPRTFSVRKYRHNLCVDHNHDTGEIRGLLCKHCNSMLSRWVHDDPKKAERILFYLERETPRIHSNRKFRKERKDHAK